MNTEILRLGKNSVIYGIGSVITRFVGVLTLPLFTTYLTPEEFGILAMLAILGMVAQPIFSLGLSAAMGPSYFEKDDLDNKSKAVWSVFGINSLSAFILLLLAWNLPTFLGGLVRLSIDYSFLVSLSLTGTALTILVTSFIQRVQFENQARLFVIITVATALTAILVSIYTVVILGLGVLGMIYGQLAGNIITFSAFFIVGLKSTNPTLCMRTVKELLRLGLPLVPSFAFLFILMHSNKYILELHSGIEAVGIYSIGFNLGMAISIITGGIATAWYPFFMSYLARLDEARIVFGRVLTYYFMSVGLLCAAFFIFARPIVEILTNNQFHESSIVVGFVALANFCIMLFNFFLPALYYEKKIKYVSLVQGWAALFSIPISYYLINRYSLLGAGIAIVISHFLMALLLFYMNIKIFKVSFIAAYEWGRVSIITLLLALIISIYHVSSSILFNVNLLTSLFYWILCLLPIYFILTNQEREYVVTLFKNGVSNGKNKKML